MSPIPDRASIPPFGTAVSAIPDDKDQRHGFGPVDLPKDRHQPRRPALGRGQPGRWDDFQVYIAISRRELTSINAVLWQRFSLIYCSGCPIIIISTLGTRNADVVAIVDDDEGSRQSLCFLLKVLGYSTQSFDSAQAFLDAGPLQFACLILDQHMPRVTGIELVEQMRCAGIDLPILLITAAPLPALCSRALELGVQKVLQKPPPEEEVLAFLTKAFL